MNLLHLSYDYPDKINPDKTEAIKRIIEITNCGDGTCCISLNRTAKLNRPVTYRDGNIIAKTTFGLPKGIFFIFTLLVSIRSVISTGLDLKSFDKVHAHKLTFEGPIAYFIRKKYKIPYIISLQQTDFKVLKHKPLMKGLYYSILREAESVILISPWMKRRLKKLFGSTRLERISQKLVNIPFIVERKCIYKDQDNGKFICVFHMRESYIKIKNIYRVLKAIKVLGDAGIQINLDIVGDGIARRRVVHMVEKLGIGAHIQLLGKVDNSRIADLMSDYRAFVLCSYPETFGMVYIEALSAGIPVIYSKDAGIDGFFNDMGIGIAVDHKSVKEICSALCTINDNPIKFRECVRNLQENGYLSKFSAEAIKQKYDDIYKKEV